jgi:hypothetical protein
MAGQFHVNGPAALWTQTAGSNSNRSSERLGISTDGVRGSFRTQDEPVFADTTGPLVPADEQQFLMDAIIRCRLIWWDESVLQKIRNRLAVYQGITPQDNAGQDGLMGLCGMLWRTGIGGSNGPMYFGLSIASPYEDLPWGFPACRLLDAQEANFGTRVTAWDLTFHAVLNAFNPDTTVGLRLYQRAMLP